MAKWNSSSCCGSTNSGFFCSAPASSDSCSWASTGGNLPWPNTLHYQAQLVYLPLLLALITEQPKEEGLPPGEVEILAWRWRVFRAWSSPGPGVRRCKLLWPSHMTLSARAICLQRQEEEAVPDGADVGDERQQPVLLPPGRLHQVAVLVQVVQQQLQREHRLPQCSQLADRAEDRGEVSVEAEQKPDRRMWLLQ